MILASASPRRRELLEQAGLVLEICPADIDETRLAHESPTSLVERLAIGKARTAYRDRGIYAPHKALLAADTIVWTGDDVLGKPRDEQDARRMLQELSNRTHHVSTGVCIITQDDQGTPQERSFVETTAVTFLPLSNDQIKAYVASGEPLDKAGAYGIQGGAGAFVSGLSGDYNNVVGLPVDRVMRELDALGICE
ncbi:MAG: Maf family protein [Coriobacteriales bacterium]|nr:Maf family protein [Coriobacteriales bacterium]